MVQLVAAGLASALFLAAPEATDGRERVDVETVLTLGAEQFVVLLRTRKEPVKHLPIWIGASEALAIRLRLLGEKPPRPLTLNLLEAVLESSHIELVEISIDAVRRGVFVGSIRLRLDGRAWVVDARPSDAIGLALGRAAPIWVSTDVLEQAAIDLDELGRDPKNAPTLPGETPYEETL